MVKVRVGYRWGAVIILGGLLLAAGTVCADTTVTVIALNDLHGHLTPEPQIPGIVKVAGEIEHLKQINPNSIFVVGGDNYQGTAISNLSYGRPVNLIYRRLGVVASAVGDHEFDWGAWRIKGWEQRGHFAYLAANIYYKKSNRPVTWAKPYLMVTRAGEKIAFIGLSTRKTPVTTNPPMVKNFKFIDDVKAMQYWINYLQAGKDPHGRPDAIIALTHIPAYQNGKVSGTEITNLCEHTKGLNAVFTAHSHLVINGKINGIPVVQGSKYGEALSLLTLTFTNDHKLLSVKPRIDLLYTRIPTLPKDQAAKRIYQKYESSFRVLLNKKLGYATRTFSYDPRTKVQTPLGTLVTGMMLDYTHTDVAILNGGTLRVPLQKGVITLGDIYSLFPFDNTVYIVKLSGSALKQELEHGIFNPDRHILNGQFSGVVLSYNSKLPFGQRITKLLIAGKPVQPNRLYSVAILDYMYNGGDSYNFKMAQSVRRTGILFRELLVESIQKRGQVD